MRNKRKGPIYCNNRIVLTLYNQETWIVRYKIVSILHKCNNNNNNNNNKEKKKKKKKEKKKKKRRKHLIVHSAR